jgi:hypothetical protein
MPDGRSNQFVDSALATRVSRRAIVSLTVKSAVGAALAAGSGASAVQLAAAQDEIILTAAASEVGARPGSAYAQGSAAFASADQDAGAITQGGTFPSSASSEFAGTSQAEGLEPEPPGSSRGPH